MAVKKTTPKKATTKAKAKSQTTPKAKEKPRAQAKKPTQKKATPKTTASKDKLLNLKMLEATHKNLARRPPSSPDMPMQYIEYINADLNEVKETLEEYANHLRALDRKRLNGVGIKLQGFVDRALELAAENPEFLPHWLTLDKFTEDDEYFIAFRTLTDLAMQIRELLWNITIQSADVVYTDALEFYASVREAAKRRVDAAETIHNELSVFFKRHKPITEEPTERQLKRDANALIHGKKDGKIVIENIKPKLTGGTRKVIDETFRDTAEFKETAEGEIKE